MGNSNTMTQKATLVVSVTTSLLTTFTGSAIILSIPNISSEFSVSAAAVGWIVTIYTLVASSFAVPFGRIADLTNRKNVLVIGLAVFALGCVMSIFAGSMAHILISRGIQAFGSAMIFATNQAILISEFDQSERGRVLGYSTAATYIGLSAGPVLGGIINDNFGWRAIFTVSIAVALLALALAILKLPSKASVKPKESLDIVGLILYSMTIIFVVYGLTDFSSNLYTLLLFPIGLILGYVFVERELETSSPLIDIKMFLNSREYTVSNITALLNYAATFAITYLVSIYLQMVQGYAAQTAGLILIVLPVVQAFVSPYAGSLSDKIRPFKLATAGMAVCAVALFMFIFLTVNSTITFVILALFTAGVGFAFFSSPNTNAAMSCVHKSQYSVASSVLSTMRNLGQTVSMVIVTIVISLNMGQKALSDAEPQLLTSTMTEAFIVFTVLCVIGVLISRTRGKKVKNL
ncbi:MAG: MFS transporter [Eubacteriales bacterium]|nr:MFS transporter [Eubacteriales bacterium]